MADPLDHTTVSLTLPKGQSRNSEDTDIFLSLSGDLGIGLVWDNHPHPTISAQQVPEPDPLPGISFDTRPDPIQF